MMKKYYFKCPNCGNDEKFFPPQEDTSNLGCLLFIVGGFLSVLFFLAHMERRVQCGKCSYIFRRPSLPSSPLVRLAQWIVFILLFFFVGTVMFSGYSDIIKEIPDYAYLREIQYFIQTNLKLATVSLVFMNLTIFVLCLMVWIIGGVSFRIKIGKEYEIAPKNKEMEED
jgi:ribosomal protein S27AE